MSCRIKKSLKPNLSIYNWLKDLRKQHNMPQSKSVALYEYGKGLKEFGTPVNHSKSHYPQMEKIWNSCDASKSS